MRYRRRPRTAALIAAMVSIAVVILGVNAAMLFSAPPGPVYNTSGYHISRTGTSPYIGTAVVPLEDTTWGTVGDDNVLVVKLQGNAVYHPVNSAWFMNQMISSYLQTKDQRYLDRATATAKYLIRGSVTDAKGAAWFPYQFSHDVGTLKLGTPWHSGMAQGMMLSTFVNLYEATGDVYWKNWAEKTFKSYSQAKSAEAPWFQDVSVLDGKKFLYFEEYPALDDSQISHVVNGDIYALFGLYDYYRMSGDGQAQWLLDTGASSIRDSFTSYRNPGQPSWYSALYYGRTVWGTPKNYHKGVISELQTLADITGDGKFNDQAALLAADYS